MRPLAGEPVTEQTSPESLGVVRVDHRNVRLFVAPDAEVLASVDSVSCYLGRRSPRRPAPTPTTHGLRFGLQPLGAASRRGSLPMSIPAVLVRLQDGAHCWASFYERTIRGRATFVGVGSS